MRAFSVQIATAVVLTSWQGVAVPCRCEDWTMLGRDGTRNAVSAEGHIWTH